MPFASNLDAVLRGGKVDKEADPNAQSEVLSSVFKALVAGIRSSNTLPAPEDVPFYNSFSEFKARNDALGNRLLGLLDRLSDHVRENAEEPSELSKQDSVLDRFDSVVDAVDESLERVDLHLDAVLGLKNDKAPASAVSTTSTGRNSRRGSSKKWQHSNLLKPQRKFKEPVDNSTRPWVPRIRFKPHALVPLPSFPDASSEAASSSASPMLSASVHAHMNKLGMTAEKRGQSFGNVYEQEIRKIQYLKDHTTVCKEQLYGSLKAVPCHWVDTEEALADMLDKLKGSPELAIDLEHHSHRSYMGITCLMQVSTRHEDFLVDTLELRDELHVLNEVFADPRVVKVGEASFSIEFISTVNLPHLTV